MNDGLAQHYPPQLVPAGYAEKAMASLMQLHSELMDEKERRVDLFRRLMEREQAVAELKMYVKMLEEKMAASAPKPMPQAAAVAEQVQASFTPLAVEGVPRAQANVQLRPPVPPQVNGRRPEGWKTW